MGRRFTAPLCPSTLTPYVHSLGLPLSVHGLKSWLFSPKHKTLESMCRGFAQAGRAASAANVSLRRSLAVSPWELREALDALGQVRFRACLWVRERGCGPVSVRVCLCVSAPVLGVYA